MKIEIDTPAEISEGSCGQMISEIFAVIEGFTIIGSGRTPITATVTGLSLSFHKSYVP